MNGDSDLSDRVRAAMAASSAAVHDRPDLAERIIRTAEHSSPPVRGWRPWLIPLAAALAVLVLFGAVVIGVRLVGSNDDNPTNPPAPSSQPTAVSPTVSPTPSPTTSNATGGPTSGGPTGSPTASAVANHPSGALPPGFVAVDLTWSSLDQGWALGTAPCASAPCTSIVRTDNGGKTWVGVPAPAAGLSSQGSCHGGCLTNLRFANATVGYAFGPEAFYQTVNGGRSWQRQAGGALGLEVADGTALRLNATCLPGCPFTVQRATVGSTSWQALALPPGGLSFGGNLSRSGHTAVILNQGHVAGGAQDARSVLFVSNNDGTSWRTVHEPCPATTTTSGVSGEVDTSAVSVAGDGTIMILCRPRTDNAGAAFAMTSTDDGVHFQRSATSLTNGRGPAGDVIAAPSKSVLLASTDALRRSVDGGRSWTVVSGAVSYLGFESPTVGRAILQPSGNGSGSATILSTVDGGAHWTSFTFPS
ncbi:MAG: hypothetical protein JWN95_1074 [Frankiales bacterium]|nr:hypothetical protein [Frankiales bacterium]